MDSLKNKLLEIFNEIKEELTLYDTWYKKLGFLFVVPFLLPFYCILNQDKVGEYSPLINLVILWIVFLLALLN